MMAVDTNILIQAHRSDADRHKEAYSRLKHLAEGAPGWGLPVFCLAEFVRVATHLRVFEKPSTLSEVSAWLKKLCSSPSVRILNPGPRFPELFLAALGSADARGNLAFDAQIAALCAEHGVSQLLTLDRDFSRFPGLQLLALD
jgi:toxin-antitoxin system PIN domain toxin